MSRTSRAGKVASAEEVVGHRLVSKPVIESCCQDRRELGPVQYVVGEHLHFVNAEDGAWGYLITPSIYAVALPSLNIHLGQRASVWYRLNAAHYHGKYLGHVARLACWKLHAAVKQVVYSVKQLGNGSFSLVQKPIESVLYVISLLRQASTVLDAPGLDLDYDYVVSLYDHGIAILTPALFQV